MTPESFAAFVAFAKTKLGWNQAELGRRLGCGPNQVRIWLERGAPLPRYIGLACSAIARHLEPWRP